MNVRKHLAACLPSVYGSAMNDHQALNNAARSVVPIFPQDCPFIIPIAVLIMLATWLHRVLRGIILLLPRILVVSFLRNFERGTLQSSRLLMRHRASKKATVVVKSSVYKLNVHMEDYVLVGSIMSTQRKEHSHA